MKLEININSFSEYTDTYLNKLIDYSPRLISAFLILFIGLYAIRFIRRVAKKILQKREIDQTLSEFLTDILIWGLRLLLFVTFISNLGIETTSFVAILGAVGLAVGMSLQGSLSNLAGGVLIVLFKPFRVGDTIEAQGVSGTVLDIEIFVTKLINGNNQTIFIPNGILSNGTIINYSMQGYRRVDLLFSLSYDTNIKVAKEIVMTVMTSHPLVMKTPPPNVSVKNLTDSAIQLSVQPWAKNEDFGVVSSDILEKCKEAFDQAGISIQPFIKESSKN